MEIVCNSCSHTRICLRLKYVYLYKNSVSVILFRMSFDFLRYKQSRQRKHKKKIYKYTKLSPIAVQNQRKKGKNFRKWENRRKNNRIKYRMKMNDIRM